MQLSKIIAIGEGKNPQNILITVLVTRNSAETKKKYEITPEDYERLGFPALDHVLSEYEIKILTRSARSKDASAVAFRILSHSDNNRASLKRKLIERGFGEETSELTVEKMVSLGYIDEYDQVYRYTVALANKKLYGEGRIIPFLLNKGYEKDDIKKALAEAQQSKDIDFEEIRSRIISKNVPDGENRAKIKQLLYKYGHSVSLD